MDVNITDVCTSPQTFITLYDQPPLQVGDYLYKNTGGTQQYLFSELQTYLGSTPTQIALERSGTVYVVVSEAGTGYAKVSAIVACPSVTPTPSTTPSVTPPVSDSPSPTPSVSISRTPSNTPSISITPTTTPSISITRTPSPSITRTPSPSITRTPSISVTPSTTDALNSTFLDMAGNAYDACHSPETFIVIYDQPPLQAGDYLYKDSTGSARYTFTELQQQLTGSPNPLYLSNGTSVYTMSPESVTDYAKVALVGTCVPVTPPASATPSPSRTPSGTPPVSVTRTPSPSVTPSKSFITPSTSSTPPASVSPTPSITPTISLSTVNCPSEALGDGATYADACQSLPTFRYMDATFLQAAIIYRFDDCTGLAPAGYYSNGVDWRYWDGTAFTTDGTCGSYGGGEF